MVRPSCLAMALANQASSGDDPGEAPSSTFPPALIDEG